MRLRTAIKIMRYIEEPWRYNTQSPSYSRRQVQEAWKVCDRKWRDHRVPMLPGEKELDMRGEIMEQLLLGGPMFGDGILEGIVSDEILDEARKELGREPHDGLVDPILAGISDTEDLPEDPPE